MISVKRFLGWQMILAMALVGACKPPEPTPSQYTNLGTDDAPLLPTPPAWHDPGILKGTAEWKTFRKPSEAEPMTASAKKPAEPKEPTGGEDAEKPAAAGGAEAEKEIREIISDFNATLADKNLEKAAEFLTDAQAQASVEVFTAVNALIEQLRALQAASPGLKEKIDPLLPMLNLSDSLKVDVQSIKLIDEKHATAKLADGSESHLEVGEENLWYVESPFLALLDKEKARIQKVTKDVEEALAKGTPDESAVSTLGAALDELRTSLSSAKAGDAQGT